MKKMKKYHTTSKPHSFRTLTCSFGGPCFIVYETTNPKLLDALVLKKKGGGVIVVQVYRYHPKGGSRTGAPLPPVLKKNYGFVFENFDCITSIYFDFSQ